IGPRPLTFEDVERLGWDDRRHDVRFSVRPGVIGLAQLYAGRGKRLSWFLDVTYVRERCAALDLRIVLATAAIAVLGKRRVRGWLRARRRRRVGHDTAPSVATPRALAWPATRSRLCIADGFAPTPLTRPSASRNLRHHAWISFRSSTWIIARCRSRRSASGIEIARSSPSATPSRSYGFTSTAPTESSM